jgi:hypothetical protein
MLYFLDSPRFWISDLSESDRCYIHAKYAKNDIPILKMHVVAVPVLYTIAVISNISLNALITNRN